MSKHTPKELGSYTVRPDGKVLSQSGWRGLELRALSSFPNEDGYHFVRLVIGGKRKKWLVHSLMAEMFLEKKPGPGFQVRHLNGDKTDNRVENLAWGTAKDNANDRDLHGKTSRGRKHTNAIKKGIAVSKANAHLIAAAPEMLEALESALAGDMFFLDKAERAIKKAKGENE